jgi:tetratricopeptide (TPR) repeat protein
VLQSEGKLAEAETMYREALVLQRKLLGKDHPSVATSVHNLACVLESRGKLAEAEIELREALVIQRKLRGNDDPAVAAELTDLGLLLEREGRLEEAEAIHGQAVLLQTERFGSHDPAVAVSISNQARVLHAQGKAFNTNSLRSIPGWGDVINPDGDCLITGQTDRLTISVPGTVHNLSSYYNEKIEMNAPRVLQEIEGDFTVQVKVSCELAPGCSAVIPGRTAFNGAGLLLWDSALNYIRVERNIWGTPDGRYYSYTPLLEYWNNGKNVTPSAGVPDSFKTAFSYLRLSRHAGEISVALSHNGVEWLPTQSIIARLPKSVKIGVAAINSSKKPFTVEFSELTLSRTGDPSN